MTLCAQISVWAFHPGCARGLRNRLSKLADAQRGKLQAGHAAGVKLFLQLGRRAKQLGLHAWHPGSMIVQVPMLRGPCAATRASRALLRHMA